MTGKKKEGGFFLDMDFGEALERYVGVKPREVEANIERSKKKPPGGKKPKRRPPGSQTKAENVVSLRERRMRRRNGR